MGTAAEIFKGAVAVEGDLLARLGEALDKIGLHKIVAGLEAVEALVTRFPLTHEGFVAGDDLCHFGFDGFEVFWGEGGGPVEVVEEAGIGGRTVAQLGFRKKLENRGRHDVRGRVADDLEGVGVFLGEEL